MFQVVHSRHRRFNSTEVESELIYNGGVIAVAVVNVDDGTTRLLSGGLDSIEEMPGFHERYHKTHVEHWTDVVKKLAANWAMRNPPM